MGCSSITAAPWLTLFSTRCAAIVPPGDSLHQGTRSRQPDLPARPSLHSRFQLRLLMLQTQLQVFVCRFTPKRLWSVFVAQRVCSAFIVQAIRLWRLHLCAYQLML